MAADTSTETLTAALAQVALGDGSPVGFMRNIRISETIQRGEVKGISNIYLQEVPPVGITCTLSCDFFFISLKRPEMRYFLNRDNGLETLVNTLILGEQPLTIYISRKKGVKEGNLITSLDDPDVIATVTDVFPTSQGFDITESQISGANMAFTYLKPIFFTS